jgi:5-methylcytosine-specific restriction endonuclease McrA
MLRSPRTEGHPTGQASGEKIASPAPGPELGPPSLAEKAISRLERHKAAQKAWREKNRDHLREYMKEWKGRDPKERAREYRAQHKHGVTRRDLMSLMARQGGACALCGVNLEKERHLDHILPRSRGGANAIENYQYLCPKCNQGKGAQTTEEFLDHCRLVLLKAGKWWE